MIKKLFAYLSAQYDLWKFSRYYAEQYLKTNHLWESALVDASHARLQHRDEIDARDERIATLEKELAALKTERKAWRDGYKARMTEARAMIEAWDRGPFPLRKDPPKTLAFNEAVEVMVAGGKCYPVRDAHGNPLWPPGQWVTIIQGDYFDENNKLISQSLVDAHQGRWRIVEDDQ